MTIDTEVKAPGFCKRNKRALLTAGPVVAIGTFGLAAGSASAALPTIPADPTAGAAEDMIGDTMAWVSTYGIPVIVLGTLFGILIKTGLRWSKKGAKAAGAG